MFGDAPRTTVSRTIIIMIVEPFAATLKKALLFESKLDSQLQHIPSKQNVSRYNNEHRTGSQTCER